MKASRFALSTLWVLGAVVAIGAALASASFARADTSSSTPVTVTIDASIDGAQATSASASSLAFPVNASWNATNVGSGSGSYTLGPSGFNSSNAYEAVTASMTSGASYSLNEDVSGAAVGASCTAGAPYVLEGYTSGDTYAAAASGTPQLTAPSLTNITSDKYIIIWNRPCIAAPTLLLPANGNATTTAGQASASWSSTSAFASPVTYVYQSSTASTTASDGSFTTPAYTSSALSTTTIATTGTPDGTYYWHVQAKDADGNMSPWSTAWSFTVNNATSTPAAPVISDVDVSNIASTSATITWTTDAAASSQVFYGTSATYSASTTLDSTAATSHSVALANLAAGTTYHLMVESGNANGSATSSDMTFVTASSTASGTGSSTPLALAGIDNNQSTAIADGAWNDGWQWTFHLVVPMDETQFALSFSDFTNNNNASSTIAAANNIRYWSAQSSNATSSASAVTISTAGQYPSTMLNLNGSTASSTGDRSVDVVVQMAVPTGTASGSYTANWNAESTSSVP